MRSTEAERTGMTSILAYLDAGTGSLLLQALLGGLAGLGVAFRAVRARMSIKRTLPSANQD